MSEHCWSNWSVCKGFQLWRARFASLDRIRHAVAREYVAGHPLGNREVVSDTFFHDLNRLLEEMHKRRTVYADLPQA